MMYLAFMANAFQSRMVYRSQVWTSLMGGLVRVLAMVAIWRSVYGDSGDVDGISLRDMMTYAILGSSVLAAYNWETLVRDVNTQIKSGDVAVFLLKPLYYPLMLFAQEAGKVAFRIMTIVIPITLISTALYGLSAPASIGHGVLFAVFWLLGISILFLLSLIAGLLAFWFMTAFSLEWVLQAFVTLLAGTVIPLWFFPSSIATVVMYQPFAWIAFYPMSVYLGKIAILDAIVLLFIGLGWAAFFVALAGWLWQRAATRLVVQGG